MALPSLHGGIRDASRIAVPHRTRYLDSIAVGSVPTCSGENPTMQRPVFFWTALLLACIVQPPATFAQSAIETPAPGVAYEPEELAGYLLDAARAGETDLVARLIEAGLDPETRDERGYTAVTLAAYAGRIETLDRLLSLGADPNAPDQRGNNPLMGAVFRGDEAAAARLLADPRTDVNARNHAGQTAAMFAAMFNRTAILDRLLAHGADLSLTAANGLDAEQLARQQGNTGLADSIAARSRP